MKVTTILASVLTLSMGSMLTAATLRFAPRQEAFAGEEFVLDFFLDGVEPQRYGQGGFNFTFQYNTNVLTPLVNSLTLGTSFATGTGTTFDFDPPEHVPLGSLRVSINMPASYELSSSTVHVVSLAFLADTAGASILKFVGQGFGGPGDPLLSFNTGNSSQACILPRKSPTLLLGGDALPDYANPAWSTFDRRFLSGIHLASHRDFIDAVQEDSRSANGLAYELNAYGWFPSGSEYGRRAQWDFCGLPITPSTPWAFEVRHLAQYHEGPSLQRVAGNFGADQLSVSDGQLAVFVDFRPQEVRISTTSAITMCSDSPTQCKVFAVAHNDYTDVSVISFGNTFLAQVGTEEWWGTKGESHPKHLSFGNRSHGVQASRARWDLLRVFAEKRQFVLDYLKRSVEQQKLLSGQFLGYASGVTIQFRNGFTPNGQPKIGTFSCTPLASDSPQQQSCFKKEIADLNVDSENWPAILGGDYGYGTFPSHYSALNSVLTDYWNYGGLVTISWHAENPWSRDFCTRPGSRDWLLYELRPPIFLGRQEGPTCSRVKTSPEQNSVLAADFSQFVDDLTNNRFTPATNKWLSDLSSIADNLEELSQAGVVVLWRPFHEMNGDWFWWSNQAPHDFIRLWRQTYEYLMESRQLKNLVWVYSVNASTPSEHRTDNPHLDYFPGNEYIDVVGIDFYGPTPSLRDTDAGWEPLTTARRRLVEEAPVSKGLTICAMDKAALACKPLALTEYGRDSHNGVDVDLSNEFDIGDRLREIHRRVPESAYVLNWHIPWAVVSSCPERQGCLFLEEDDALITRGDLCEDSRMSAARECSR